HFFKELSLGEDFMHAGRRLLVIMLSVYLRNISAIAVTYNLKAKPEQAYSWSLCQGGYSGYGESSSAGGTGGGGAGGQAGGAWNSNAQGSGSGTGSGSSYANRYCSLYHQFPRLALDFIPCNQNIYIMHQ
ncbi:hypothetical protein ACJX0J_012879, partial [Zea mays]